MFQLYRNKAAIVVGACVTGANICVKFELLRSQGALEPFKETFNYPLIRCAP